MERDTVNLREDRMVVMTYDESAYHQGHRTQQQTIIGTPEQIGERVKQSIIAALGYNSHLTTMHLTPIQPYNIFRLEGDGS